MPDVLIRDVDDRTLSKLKSRAKKNGRSLQNELLQVFKTIVRSDGPSDLRSAERIKESLRGRTYSDSAALVRKDRQR